MAKILLHFAIVVGTFLLLARYLPGFYVPDIGTAILAALVLGLVNATIGPVLTFLSLPLIVVSLGLFWFVLNAALLILVAFIVPGFAINGWGPALIGAVILAAVNLVWKRLSAASEKSRD
ncbi:MAG TPA: phage holin family protein [Candidatus Eisenbacteria bacterium]|nr:phage holin family protein [Candidatus Eisenbacteria bacterium]